MRTAFYERTGPAAEVLRVEETPRPEAGAGEVRVKLHASGVNPSDVKGRGGVWGRQLPFPQIVPHSDGAGVIDQVGAGVPPSRVGERVYVFNAQWKRPFGTAAEWVTVPAAHAVVLPEALSFAQGACLGIPALTAWRALDLVPVEGRTVLVHGGAGAVGHSAVQLARAMGARVLATVSNEEKAGIARDAGASDVFDYRAPDAAERILKATGGRGVDLVLEVDFARNAALDFRVTADHGTIAVYGTTGLVESLDALMLLVRSLSVRGFLVYELPKDVLARGLEKLDRFIRAGALTPRVAHALPLERIADAHALVEGGRAVGNVVVELA